MLRQDFIDNVENFSDLKEFCYDNDCYECDDVVGEDTFDEWIEDNLVSWARDESFSALRDRLNSLYDESGYDWYVWSEDYDQYYHATDHDFEHFKDLVLEWADDHETWDDADDEDDEEVSAEEQTDPEDLEPTPTEDCSIDEFFAAGIGCLRVIREEALAEARAQDLAYAKMFSQHICGNQSGITGR